MTTITALLVVVVGSWGCSAESGASFDPAPDPMLGAPGTTQESSKARDTAPNVADETLATLAEGNASFAWSFYQEAVPAEGNFFFSPYSISIALAMTSSGARGNTLAEMTEALDFRLPEKQLHPAFNRMDLELAARAGASIVDPGALPFVLNISNALFTQAGFPLLDSFLDVLAVNYGVGVQSMDFVADAEPSREAINAWVSERTDMLIPNLLPPQSITGDTRLVLVNAILFTASWDEPFDEAETRDAPFRLLDDTEISVSTMHASVATQYAEGDDWKAAILPYDGGQLGMLLIVPDEGVFPLVEASMTAARTDEIMNAFELRSVAIALPSFEFRAEVPSRGPLMALGMVDAFDSNAADLSGMNGATDLFIDNVIHEAFVSVDEKGTKAAAATAVTISVDSAGPERAQLSVDRPFMFAIIDRPTGATLFLGRVVDPSK